MSFCFNFADPINSGEKSNDIKSEEPHDVEDTEDFKEVTEDDIPAVADSHTKVYNLTSYVCIRCLDSQSLEQKLSRTTSGDGSSIQQAASQHSDLIPNVYEGGLTVWECSLDLAQYLLNCDECLADKKVLELGCGAGIPGILAMIKGAACVHFQDYNREVIEHYTVANVKLNRPEHSTCKCRYFSGDWNKFKTSLSHDNIKYDVILTAETIYKPANYKKLLDIFEHFLEPGGTVYVAAKSNYFGVGGGTRDFEEYVTRHGVFTLETSHVIQAGVPREILKMKFAKH